MSEYAGPADITAEVSRTRLIVGLLGAEVNDHSLGFRAEAMMLEARFEAIERHIMRINKALFGEEVPPLD